MKKHLEAFNKVYAGITNPFNWTTKQQDYSLKY